jgi:hypothetical protein
VCSSDLLSEGRIKKLRVNQQEIKKNWGDGISHGL